MYTQEQPTGGTAPFLPGSRDEGCKAILSGGFQILQQVLTIPGDIPFVQILDAPAGVLRTLRAQRSRVAMLFRTVLYAADSAMVRLAAISQAADAFVPGALESHTEVADDTAGGKAFVVHTDQHALRSASPLSICFRSGIRSFSSW